MPRKRPNNNPQTKPRGGSAQQPKRSRRRRSRRPTNGAVINPPSTTKQMRRYRQSTRPLLHGCGLNYAAAIINPQCAPLACVPSFYPTWSLTERVWARVTFSPPVAGGFVVVDPQSMGFNNRQALVASGPTYAPAAAGFIELDRVLSQYALGLSNSSHSDAELNATVDSLNFRVVGCSLEIEYVGTELNMGGTYAVLSDINHDTLHNNTEAQILGKNNAASIATTRKPVTTWYQPSFTTDFTLNGGNFPANSSPGPGPPAYNNRAFYYMGAYITPAAANSKYRATAYAQIEFSGRTVRGAKPTLSDPNGLASTLDQATRLIPTDSDSRSYSSQFLGYVEAAAANLDNVVRSTNQVLSIGKGLYSATMGMPDDIGLKISQATLY